MILSATWGESFYVCLTEPPGFSHGEHQNPDNIIHNSNDKEATATIPTELTRYCYFGVPLNTSILKSNTTYTMICETNGIRYLSLSAGDKSVNLTTDIIVDGEGLKAVTFTTDTIESSYPVTIFFYARVSSTFIGTAYLKDAMLLEGDWTDKEIPPFFEGMQSSFEDKLQDDGSYKIEAISYKAKIQNQLPNPDLSLYTFSSSRVTVEGDWNVFEWNIGDYSLPKKDVFKHTTEVNHGDKIYVRFDVVKLSDTTYNGSVWFGRIGGYDDIIFDGEFYNSLPLNQQLTLSVTTVHKAPDKDPRSFYLNFGCYSRELECKFKIKDITVVNLTKFYGEGNEPTTEWCDENIPYYKDNEVRYTNMNKIQFSSIEPLRGLSNGVKDRMIKIDDNWYVERNCAQRPYIEGDESLPNVKTDLVNTVYPLDNPVYEKLNIDLSVPLYLGTTHITTNSTIPANLKVTVDRTANLASDAIKLANENPTIENLSKARYWTNLLKESVLKDNFQSQISNTTNLEDMVVERKTVSLNVDVYIKSENMLLMSLSTNQITFEDFSGVSDMLKDNAIEISVNSSLPYNLNSYLVSEIQNSDKTNTMEKETLQLKEDSEVDYQYFNNTNDKMILKSSCEAGNDKKHNIDLKLKGGLAFEKDVYKTTIKFEAEQI